MIAALEGSAKTRATLKSPRRRSAVLGRAVMERTPGPPRPLAESRVAECMEMLVVCSQPLSTPDKVAVDSNEIAHVRKDWKDGTHKERTRAPYSAS